MSVPFWQLCSLDKSHHHSSLLAVWLPFVRQQFRHDNLVGLRQICLVDCHQTRNETDNSGPFITAVYDSRGKTLPIISVFDFYNRCRICRDARRLLVGFRNAAHDFHVKDGGEARLTSAGAWVRLCLH